MSYSPNQPIFPESSAERIGANLDVAVLAVQQGFQQQGGALEYYRRAFDSTPPVLRDVVVASASAYRPSQNPEPHKVHPDAHAIIRGLIIGADMGCVMLCVDYDRPFRKEMAENLRRLRMHSASGPYDLRDYLIRGGRPTAEMLSRVYGSALLDMGAEVTTPAQEDRQRSYAVSIGYMVGAAITRATEMEIRQHQRTDSSFKRSVTKILGKIERGKYEIPVLTRDDLNDPYESDS